MQHKNHSTPLKMSNETKLTFRTRKSEQFWIRLIWAYFWCVGLMDSVSKQVLSVDIVACKSTLLSSSKKLKDNNMIIQSIICDGRKGLPQLFADIPVQLCQFHQVQTVIRYLIHKPKSLAAEQLRALTLTLTVVLAAFRLH
ncbi:hypothetical protein QDY69_10685 [Kingella negevensis]|uniref:hypothetical protein n=1 Tax=Kingella negevensis TaxID=1522312 RepID=UPI00254CC30F|nr:hypothetical protein [Kingella negevensis]MDK4683372.1 hypothetical protein [Kingella negevensis]